MSKPVEPIGTTHFDKWWNLLTMAKSVRRLNQLDLQIVQDKTLLSFEVYALGRHSAHVLRNRQTKRTK